MWKWAHGVHPSSRSPSSDGAGTLSLSLSGIMGFDTAQLLRCAFHQVTWQMCSIIVTGVRHTCRQAGTPDRNKTNLRRPKVCPLGTGSRAVLENFCFYGLPVKCFLALQEIFDSAVAKILQNI